MSYKSLEGVGRRQLRARLDAIVENRPDDAVQDRDENPPNFPPDER